MEKYKFLFEEPQSRLESFLASHMNSQSQLQMQERIQLYYFEGLSAYLSGQTSMLRQIIFKIENQSKDSVTERLIIELLQLRLAIREFKTEEIKRKLNQIKYFAPFFLNDLGQNKELSIYSGEYFFVCARGYELIADNEKAAHYYDRAAKYFKSQGLYRKQIKSEFNAIICLEHGSDEVEIEKYNDLLKFAIQQRDPSVIGSCLHNIAFRLLFIGAYHSAEKILRYSLRFLSVEKSSLNFDLARLNFAHLYFLNGNRPCCLTAIEQLKNSPYVEIQTAVNALLLVTGQSDSEIDNSKITQGWLWRLRKDLSSLPELSELEDQLVGYLALKPRSRDEIIKKLWAGSIDSENLLARFKRVLARIKVKRKNIVFFKKSKYHLRIDCGGPLRKINDWNLSKEDGQLSLKIQGLELQLQKELKAKALSFYEILDIIYGSKCSIEQSTNRLKNLLARMRKKFPNNIQFYKGKYHWIS